MNPKYLLFLSVTVVLLSGCGAALVPYTSDPNTKLKNSYALLSTGRAIPAEKFAKEALETFENENNFEGMAEAHVFRAIVISGV